MTLATKEAKHEMAELKGISLRGFSDRPVVHTILLPHLEVAGFLGGSTNPYGH